ncbi:hypothetical protein MBLNU13_g07861t1 [Cladosporium sp. NU13]
MSGLEIVGVILGAFPLAISAMEHYEECKKVAGTFYKIRRAHRKDFGRVKDCQLKFRLNMKELLLPLLADDLVSKIEYEQLIASPGGPGWQEGHVEESLVERLGDCHERYIEILKEMEETMVLLCKATKVDDEQFQALLKSQNPIPQQFTGPSIMVQSTHAAAKSSSNGMTFTLNRKDTRVSWAQGCQQQQQQQQNRVSNTPTSTDLAMGDLCETMRASSAKNGECYGGFTDVTSDRYYTVSALESPSQTTHTIALAEIINGTASVTLTRIQRYSIAATLASSLLQLESTSWCKGWTAEDVHFAHDINGTQNTPPEYDKPFFLAPFVATSPTLDDRFKSIGTLLLELCFGKLLDQHALWQQAGFSAAKTNPMMRHFVACEWSKDVEGEAGEQYASAVRFCLHQGPAVLQDEKWRTEFAQAVVWPLQQCYESMQPSKRGI